jgi:CubicO group peptidase (beta-lactamase class C family)
MKFFLFNFFITYYQCKSMPKTWSNTAHYLSTLKRIIFQMKVWIYFFKIGEKVQKTDINSFSNLDPELERIFNGVIDSTFREYQPIGISAEVRLGEDKYWKASMGISHGQTKINPDDIMGIASMTKLFTAAAILKFAEEGKLKLTDSIKKYLPNQKNVNLNATVYQLLNMTAGT